MIISDVKRTVVTVFCVVFFFGGGGGCKDLVAIPYTCEELAPNPNTSEVFSDNF